MFGIPGAPRRDRSHQGTVAIVVPLGSRQEFSPEEELSLRHLCHYLGAYDKYLLAPAGHHVQRDGFRTMHMPRKFFGSAPAHGNLMIWRPFFRRFSGYDYILIYHLDSLVFSDDLLAWCRAGYDYIGAPWLPCRDSPWVTEERVGNGGFTLWRVDSSRRVLRSRHRREPLTRVVDLVARNMEQLAPLYRLMEAVHRRWPLPFLDRVLQHRARTLEPAFHGTATDQFWSIDAKRYLPSFRVASVDEALKFAFEVAPRECFERNGRRVPFGCHAWAKFDRAFWEPFLLRE